MRFGYYEDRQERLNLPVAKHLRDSDDRLLGLARDQTERSRRGDCPPSSLFVIGITPALAGGNIESAAYSPVAFRSRC